jgi:tetratricopeptide (TPR) repeat protein
MEARSFAEQALALPGVKDHPAAYEKALEAAGGIAYWQADMPASRDWYTDALELARARGDDRAVANALYNLTFTYSLSREDQVASLAFAEEALEVNRRVGDDAGIGRALWALASAHFYFGDREKAREEVVEALALLRKIDDRFMVGWTQYMAGMIQLGFDLDEMRASLAEALDIFLVTDDVTGYSLVFDGFAGLAHAAGDDISALRLAGYAAAAEKSAGSGLGAVNREFGEFYPERLTTTPEYEAAYAEGQKMSLDEAVAIARAVACIEVRPAP